MRQPNLTSRENFLSPLGRLLHSCVLCAPSIQELARETQAYTRLGVKAGQLYATSIALVQYQVPRKEMRTE